MVEYEDFFEDDLEEDDEEDYETLIQELIQNKEKQNKEKQNEEKQTIKKSTTKPDIKLKIIEKILIKHFRRQLQLFSKKTSRKKRIELQNTIKNYLFNCIRKHYNEPTKTYKEDKEKYFKNTATLITDKKEIINFPICSCDNPDMILTSNSTITCKNCGEQLDLQPTQTTFVQQHHNIVGTKDKLGWFWEKRNKEDIVKSLMREYLEESPFVYSQEEIEAHLKKLKENNKSLKELKKEAFNIIQNQRPDVFQNDYNRKILAQKLKLDITILNEIGKPKNINEKSIDFIFLKNVKKDSQLNEFKKWKQFYKGQEIDDIKKAFILWKSLGINQNEAITLINKDIKQKDLSNENKKVQKEKKKLIKLKIYSV